MTQKDRLKIFDTKTRYLDVIVFLLILLPSTFIPGLIPVFLIYIFYRAKKV